MKPLQSYEMEKWKLIPFPLQKSAYGKVVNSKTKKEHGYLQFTNALYKILTEQERRQTIIKIDYEKKEYYVSVRIINKFFKELKFICHLDKWVGHTCICGINIKKVYSIQHIQSNTIHNVGCICIYQARLKPIELEYQKIRCKYCNIIHNDLSDEDLKKGKKEKWIQTDTSRDCKSCKVKLFLKYKLEMWRLYVEQKKEADVKWSVGKYKGMKMSEIDKINPTYFTWVIEESYMSITHKTIAKNWLLVK